MGLLLYIALPYTQTAKAPWVWGAWGLTMAVAGWLAFYAGCVLFNKVSFSETEIDLRVSNILKPIPRDRRVALDSITSLRVRLDRATRKYPWEARPSLLFHHYTIYYLDGMTEPDAGGTAGIGRLRFGDTLASPTLVFERLQSLTGERILGDRLGDLERGYAAEFGSVAVSRDRIVWAKGSYPLDRVTNVWTIYSHVFVTVDGDGVRWPLSSVADPYVFVELVKRQCGEATDGSGKKFASAGKRRRRAD